MAAAGEQHTDPVHFVQMWVVPDEDGIEPGYAQREIDAELLSGALVPVASGMPEHGDSAIRIANRYATLHAARLEPGQSVTLPDAPYLHLFVARGDVTLEGAGALAGATPCGSPRPAASSVGSAPIRRTRRIRSRDPGVGDARVHRGRVREECRR